MKISSLQKRVSKITAKKFDEIDPGLTFFSQQDVVPLDISVNPAVAVQVDQVSMYKTFFLHHC
jgi:hypothetical protein